MAEAQGKIRVDKWLWHARFFKTRTLASKLVRAGKLRVNGDKIVKASALLLVGDVLTFPKVNDIKVVKLRAFGVRRGPASEAQTLYEDQTPSPVTKTEAQKRAALAGSIIREAGAGRPTKAERRATDKLMGRD